jgi:CrcB protein
MKEYLLVGLGGALGAISRFAVSRALPEVVFEHFPAQIFLINAVGCLMMGCVAELLEKLLELYLIAQASTIKLFLATGFLGGFTTFSSFTLEFGNLVAKNLDLLAILYVVLSVCTAILGFVIGSKITHLLISHLFP